MDDKTHARFLVRVELRRIQTYLFAVPRLRAMLGANALLGDTIRHALPALLPPPGPNGVFSCKYAPPRPPAGALGLSVPDPLAQAASSILESSASRSASLLTDCDDPAACFDRGILARDGGHLLVLFSGTQAADRFCADVRRTMARALPGLSYTLEVEQVDPSRGFAPISASGRSSPAPTPSQIDELPQFQVCEASGRGSAASWIKDKEQCWSRESSRKIDAGAAFQQNKPFADRSIKRAHRDLVSLLRPCLPGYDDSDRQPEDLEDLADRGRYVALIHADGNRVGQRLVSYLERPEFRNSTWLDRQTAAEQFFHGMRTAVRRSIVDSLAKVFPVSDLKEEDAATGVRTKLRYQLLMLGGDDLLLLCQPRQALPFVVELARNLRRYPLADGQPLSIGAGVVIAKHSLPFHRLHSLAESLAESAKRRFLQYSTIAAPGEQPHIPQRSVVDWALTTSNWVRDPLTHRRQQDLVRYDQPLGAGNESLVLTGKPYLILDPTEATENKCELSLERLLVAAGLLGKTKPLPRSQLKAIYQEFAEGRRWAKLRWQEMLQLLPETARQAFEIVASSESPWLEVETDCYLTRATDLIEISELQWLGRQMPSGIISTPPGGNSDKAA